MSLADQIKNLQRSDPNAKQAWWDYCDQELGGVKDPNRHDEASLQNFLSRFGGGGGGPPRSSRVPMKGGGGGKGGMMMMKGKAPMGMGMGGCMVGMAPMSASGAADLSSWVKLGQKSSQPFKESWQMYCSMYGGGVNDPSRHDPGYIGDFINYLGQVAQADLGAAAAQAGMMSMGGMGMGMGGGMGMGMGGGMVSRKRPMSGGGGGGPPKRAAPAGGGDGEKADLVNRVKQLQRRDAETKQAWWDFTDNNHGGVHDPNRHDKEVLQEFLASYE